MNRPKIVVLGTGGTLAGTSAQMNDNLGYRAAQIEVAELLAAIPPLAGLPVVSEQVAQIDSKDMVDAVWARLVSRCSHWLAQPDVQGLVVTHGTDTLEETAYVLHALLAPAKPVVLTCAMRPATALSPDGPQNIVDAVTVASWRGARGVVAVCAGVIHGALDVRKQHTWRLDAFGSGDAGPIGFVEEAALRLVRDWPPAQPPHAALASVASGAAWPWVEIVTSHAGASGGIVESLVRDGVRGLVVAGTGNGTIHHALETALDNAREQGVRVVRATRCAQGQVLGGSGQDALESAGGLSPVKARIALQLALMAAPAR